MKKHKILPLLAAGLSMTLFAQNNGEQFMEKLCLDEEAAIERDFYISDITPETFAIMKGKSYKDYCTLPLEDLKQLNLLHKNLKGQTLSGQLICNKIIAGPLLTIFKELYAASYPIEKIRLVDEYDADDEKSMADNNTSCFNFRFISYTQTVSKHGAGLAVDINPLYNPYIKKVHGKLHIEPANGEPYTDRSKTFPYKIDENDLAYKLFTAAGFEWGGSWSSSKDYQHFEWKD